MPAFPRTIVPARVSPFRVAAGLVARGHTGRDQLRAIVSMGREWDEVYSNLKTGTPSVDALLAFIEDAYNQSKTFTIAHLISPGSGRDPHGAGGGTPLVKGSGQTGATLETDGWSNGVTNVVRAGDVMRITGLSPLFRILADANSDGSGNASLTINPPIPAGVSPADNAPITRTGCTLNAYIAAAPNIPEASPGRFIDGLRITYREAL